jgi:hypothetical protein
MEIKIQNSSHFALETLGHFRVSVFTTCGSSLAKQKLAIIEVLCSHWYHFPTSAMSVAYKYTCFDLLQAILREFIIKYLNSAPFCSNAFAKLFHRAKYSLPMWQESLSALYKFCMYQFRDPF